MKHLVRPNFSHEKLEPPLFKDVVDVFEDRMRCWLIEPAKKLLLVKHGEVAAVALATNYIEGIEIYASGKDSKRKSKEFFRLGYKKIFAAVSGPDYMQDAIADGLYEMLRCGFAHDGMFRSGIYFSTTWKEAMLITWPKKNGQFDPNGKLESVIINPKSFVRCIELHFNAYLRELRARKSNDVQDRFKSAVAIKWQLGKPGPYVGMTEDQFYSGVLPSDIAPLLRKVSEPSSAAKAQ